MPPALQAVLTIEEQLAQTPELHMPLPANQVLLTRPLRDAGYYTAAAGKWHLGPKSTQQLDLVIEGGGPSGSDQWLWGAGPATAGLTGPGWPGHTPRVPR